MLDWFESVVGKKTGEDYCTITDPGDGQIRQTTPDPSKSELIVSEELKNLHLKALLLIALSAFFEATTLQTPAPCIPDGPDPCANNYPLNCECLSNAPQPPNFGRVIDGKPF